MVRSIKSSAVFAIAGLLQPTAIVVHSFSPVAPQLRPHSRTNLWVASSDVDTVNVERACRTAVLSSLKNPRAVILDARSWEEIEKADGAYLPPRLATQRWMQVSGCTPHEAPLLKLAARHMLPDPTVPILVYCASGKRAARARQTLLDQGYIYVLNVGGTKDIEEFMP